MLLLRRIGNAVFGLAALLSVVISIGPIAQRPILVSAVMTNSMSPLLREGDVIAVAPLLGKRELSVGTVVVFRNRQTEQWIVHRVIGGSAEEGYETRGDANPVPDPDRVYPEDMAGTVPFWQGHALRVPRLGRLSTRQGSLPKPVVTLAFTLAAAGLMWRAAGRRRIRYPLLESYAALAGVVFTVAFMAGYAMSRHEPVTYEVINPPGPAGRGQVIAGARSEQTVEYRNGLPLPMLLLVRSADSRLRFEPPYALARPKGLARVTYVVDEAETGRYTGAIDVVATLPVAPPVILLPLLRVGIWAPLLAVSAIPSLLVWIAGVGDRKLRAEFDRLWEQIRHS